MSDNSNISGPLHERSSLFHGQAIKNIDRAKIIKQTSLIFLLTTYMNDVFFIQLLILYMNATYTYFYNNFTCYLLIIS